jgi:hypothetical protein
LPRFGGLFFWKGIVSMLPSQLSLILRGIIVVAALMLTGGSALAEDTKSANYIMPGCRKLLTNDNSEAYLQGFCSGLIKGVFYLAEGTCPPPGVTGSQIGRVVVQYIDARPASMHEDFRELALEALKAAWPSFGPCKR